MIKNIVDISKLLTDPKFQELQSLGLIDEIALRNYTIKYEYRHLRKTISQTQAISQLSEKYNLSFDSINSILFRNRNLKMPVRTS
jgi:hypothetical protein